MQLFSAGGGQREGRVADLAQRSAAAAAARSRLHHTARLAAFMCYVSWAPRSLDADHRLLHILGVVQLSQQALPGARGKASGIEHTWQEGQEGWPPRCTAPA